MKTIRSTLLLTVLLLAGKTFAQTGSSAGSTGNRLYGAVVDPKPGRFIVKVHYYGDDEKPRLRKNADREVDSYAAMNALRVGVNSYTDVTVIYDEKYDETASKYRLYALADGITHAQKFITNREK